MKVSEKKTKLTRTTDGFDFLGWRFKVQTKGKFRSVPSVDNFKAFRQKVKSIVNNSNYGATVKESEAGCDESRTPRFNREVRGIIPAIDSTSRSESYHKNFYQEC